MRSARTSHSRLALTPIELLWLLLMIFLLAMILLPALSRDRRQAKTAVCASNLKGLGMGCYIYANDNIEWFPIDYYNPKYETRDDGTEVHGVQWVGAMGSNDSLKISQATTWQVSPQRNHPSRSLFLFLTGGYSVPDQFICPQSSEIGDNLRNYGPDAGNGKEQAALPGVTRFDFPGYNSLSYGYQLPFGPRAQPHTARDSRMAILADKGPYYADGGPGLDGTRTVRDKLSGVKPPAEWRDRDADGITGTAVDWTPYNSRNHGGTGQNVCFVDGHVAFCDDPLAGVDRNNIYTVTSAPNDVRDSMIGFLPSADATVGPRTQTDSFIVP